MAPANLTVETLADDVDVMFILIGAVLVFFMQAGFSMLEVGSVQAKSTKNVLVKNAFDAAIAAVCWTTVGHGFAFGDSAGGFIGTDNFALHDGRSQFSAIQYAEFLFQWSFVATSTTIVSGAVAERITFHAYVFFAALQSSFTYPLIVHWVWNDEGWLSAGKSDNPFLGCGVLDFAGSGVVHISGGIAAFVAVSVLGVREGVTFIAGRKLAPEGQSVIFQTLGCFMLWFGWFGFNGTSGLGISGLSLVAARSMVMTAISSSVAGIVTSALHYVLERQIKISHTHNGILAGLVAMTANCATTSVEGAFIIGAVAGFVYLLSSRLMEKIGLDDVVNAAPVHFFAGMWGVFAAGLLTVPASYRDIYQPDRASKCAGLLYGGHGNQLAANFIYMWIIIFWSGTISFIYFYALKRFGMLRLSTFTEKVGIDIVMHREGFPESEGKEMDLTWRDDGPTAATNRVSELDRSPNVLAVEQISSSSPPPTMQIEMVGANPHLVISES